MRIHLRQLLVVLLLLTQGIGASALKAAPLQQTTVPLETPFEVGGVDEPLVGESPNGIYIMYGSTLYDKRCPPEETCEKAGNALFTLLVSSEDRSEADIFQIGTAPDQQVAHFLDYSIELVAVDPPALKPDDNIVLVDYRLTLIVRADGESTPAPEEKTESTTPLPPQDEDGASIDAIIVDRCVNFTPFDAAAVLQEPVNADEPIGNLLFGPLPADYLGDEAMLQGLCGYAGSEPTGDIDPSQTHILTAIGSAHAVAAQHLTAEVTPNANGTVQSDFFALMLLAEAMGAANPDHDSQEIFDVLYNFAGHFPLLEVLQYDAEQAPSFQVEALEPTAAEGYEELFWFWQTLDEGYFALLVGRTGLDFDLVAARLGQQVREKSVQGYARVILNKLVASSDDDQHNSTGNGGTVGCDLLTLDDVEGILQDAIDSQAVANEEGDGCKYTYIDDAQSIDPADFSAGFESHGLLVGVVPPKAAQTLLNGMVEELSATGNVQDGDALQSLLDALQAEDWSSTLAQIATLEWDSSEWQVTALSEVSDDTLFITGESGSGWPQFFLFHPHNAGGVYLMMGVLPMEVDTVREAISVAAQNLAEPTDASEQSSTESNATTAPQPMPEIGCSLVEADMVAQLLGAAVDEHPVAGEHGNGCKYTPQSEQATVDPTDFSPDFANAGVMIGIMPGADALWMLGSLLSALEEDGIAADALDPLRTALDAEDVPAALAALTAFDGQGDSWHVTALPEVSERAAGVSGEPEEDVHVALFFDAQDDGTLLILTIQQPTAVDLDGIHDLVVAIMQAK